MTPPMLVQRREIFEFWLLTVPHSNNGDTTVARWANMLAPRTAGCFAADIRRICVDALTNAATRLPRTASINDSIVTWEDVKEAARSCVPSKLSLLDVIPTTSTNELRHDTFRNAKRGFEVAWKKFGGYDEEKKRLYRTVVRPWMYHIMECAPIPGGVTSTAQSSEVGTALGMSKPSGVLSHGLSGCGK